MVKMTNTVPNIAMQQLQALYKIALSPGRVSEKMLGGLIDLGIPEILNCVAKRNDLNEGLFRKLDRQGMTTLYLAENSKRPVDMLEKFSRDKRFLVREQVAENRSTPQAILKSLCNDAYKYVQYAVARNDNLSFEL